MNLLLAYVCCAAWGYFVSLLGFSVVPAVTLAGAGGAFIMMLFHEKDLI